MERTSTCSEHLLNVGRRRGGGLWEGECASACPRGIGDGRGGGVGASHGLPSSFVGILLAEAFDHRCGVDALFLTGRGLGQGFTLRPEFLEVDLEGDLLLRTERKIR